MRTAIEGSVENAQSMLGRTKVKFAERIFVKDFSIFLLTFHFRIAHIHIGASLPQLPNASFKLFDDSFD